ncbi:MAG: hypothetical protein ACPGLV_01640 [Bacteroidia bacterium]
MKNLFAFVLLSSFALTACNGLFNSDNCNDCDGVNCTEEFKMIQIEVVDKDGNAVSLNDYNITFKNNGETVDSETNDRLIYAEGYVIATDSDMEQVTCDGTKVVFSYSLNGKDFDEETFLIGKDCCHIQWRDDKAKKIIID